MTYLLDVNALLALAYEEHLFHTRLGGWLTRLDFQNDVLASCSITELGLVRILPQLPETDFTFEEARHLLSQIKATSKLPFVFLTDHLGVDQMPGWVKKAKQTTDGHLAALAKAHQASLATMDERIPGAFLIPALA